MHINNHTYAYIRRNWIHIYSVGLWKFRWKHLNGGLHPFLHAPEASSGQAKMEQPTIKMLRQLIFNAYSTHMYPISLFGCAHKYSKFFVVHIKAITNLIDSVAYITVTTTDIKNFSSVRLFMSTINPDDISYLASRDEVS